MRIPFSTTARAAQLNETNFPSRYSVARRSIVFIDSLCVIVLQPFVDLLLLPFRDLLYGPLDT